VSFSELPKQKIQSAKPMNEQAIHHGWTPLEELHVARELLRLHQCPARQILYSPEQSHARALEKRLLT